MSKKKILGIDIGQNSLKLVQMSGNTIVQAVSLELPEKLVQNGRIVSIETMSELIRAAMKENHMSCRHAACTIGNNNVFTGIFHMPRMTHDQLMVNLPYEFRDYITGDLRKYVYDYAIISDSVQLSSAEEEGSEKNVGMKLFGVAAPIDLIDELTAMISKCGMKLDRLAPSVSAIIGLHRAFLEGDDTEYCVLDVGQQAARMHIFRGDEFIVTRTIESGIAFVEEALADSMGLTVELAHTYIRTNYDDCHHGETCSASFNRLAVEIMRALNFYRFSNPDNRLEKIYISGGGAEIEALVDAISETVDLPVLPIVELLPVDLEDAVLFAPAVGITMD